MLEHIRVHRREVTKDHLRETMHLFRSVLPAAFLMAGSVDSSSSIAVDVPPLLSSRRV
jgi:hypothetical protein